MQFAITLLGALIVHVTVALLEMEKSVMTLMNATIPQKTSVPLIPTASISKAHSRVFVIPDFQGRVEVQKDVKTLTNALCEQRHVQRTPSVQMY